MSAAFERLIRVRSRQREIDTVWCVVCPRGGSGRAGAGLVVVQGRGGGERSGSGVSYVPTWLPTGAIAH